MKTITKIYAVTLLLLSVLSMSAQTFVWDKSELTVGWANSGTVGTTVKTANGVTLQQRGTTGVATSYIGVDNSNQTLSLYSTSSDAVTITSSSDIITSVKITYSSNSSTTTTNPYVGYHSTPTAMDDAANPLAIVSSCELTAGVYGNVGVQRTYTPPAGTKFVILVRGATCGTVTSPSVTCRIYRIEVFTSPVTPTISAFNIAGVEATIDQNAKTITAELPYGSSLSNLTPTVTLGGTATSYTPLGAQDFTNPVHYIASDGGSVTTDYTVTITVNPTPSNDATLSDLQVDGTTITGFNPATLTYDVALPFAYVGLPIITAITNNISANQVIVNASSIPGTATVTVTAQDGTTQKIYTINFTRIPASSACDITSFVIGVKRGVITNQDILVKMPIGTDVTNLTPVVAVSNLANYTPQGGMDFTNPVNYIVTAEDGTTKTYTVTVQLVNPMYTGPYPYETIFPTGYVLPDWMSSPQLDGISFVDPYGTPTTGSDKVLWYDNQAETDAATASVLRISTAASLELFLSKCEIITAQLSATGTRTYRLYVNDELKVTSPLTSKDTKVTLNYNVNLNQPVVLKINTVETTGGATLGYLKIESSFGSGISTNKIEGVYFDGQIIQNKNNINLQLFDTRGTLISTSNQNMNLSNYPKGIYIVKSEENTLKIALTK